MAYSAKILCDSISPDDIRLTTLEVTLPRIVLSEFNTHRMLSRNSSSSRARPVEKQIKDILDDPFIPEYWGKNQKGMQAEEELIGQERKDAIDKWIQARDNAVMSAKELLKTGVHKQLTNRLLEPWMWQTIITSATEWSNFFALRRHKDAQPEIKKAADLMHIAINDSKPKLIFFDEYHLPLIQDGELEELKKQGLDPRLVSVGRCCRVSYLTHLGVRDPKADVELAIQLQTSGHMSPYEHIATPTKLAKDMFIGNFRGWVQLRKILPNEDDYSKIISY
jgi:hypothetical protein